MSWRHSWRSQKGRGNDDIRSTDPRSRRFRTYRPGAMGVCRARFCGHGRRPGRRRRRNEDQGWQGRAPLTASGTCCSPPGPATAARPTACRSPSLAAGFHQPVAARSPAVSAPPALFRSKYPSAHRLRPGGAASPEIPAPAWWSGITTGDKCSAPGTPRAEFRPASLITQKVNYFKANGPPEHLTGRITAFACDLQAYQRGASTITT
jgi:hypothetical protein